MATPPSPSPSPLAAVLIPLLTLLQSALLISASASFLSPLYGDRTPLRTRLLLSAYPLGVVLLLLLGPSKPSPWRAPSTSFPALLAAPLIALSPAVAIGLATLHAAAVDSHDLAPPHALIDSTVAAIAFGTPLLLLGAAAAAAGLSGDWAASPAAPSRPGAPAAPTALATTGAMATLMAIMAFVSEASVAGSGESPKWLPAVRNLWAGAGLTPPEAIVLCAGVGLLGFLLATPTAAAKPAPAKAGEAGPKTRAAARKQATEKPPAAPVTKQGRRRGRLLAVVAFALAGAVTLYAVPQCTRGIPDGDTPKFLSRSYSTTGYISTVETVVDAGIRVRVMRSDHSIIGGHFLVDEYRGSSIYGCFYFLSFVKDVMRTAPTGRRRAALNIGLGIGVAATELMRAGVDVDIAELDGAVVEAAQAHFGMPAPRRTHVGDGRALLDALAGSFLGEPTTTTAAGATTPTLGGKKKKRATVGGLAERWWSGDASRNETVVEKRRYEFVLHDVFANGFVPEQLFSVEAMERVRDVMVADGVLALNFVGRTESKAVKAVHATIGEVFEHVRVFVENGPTEAQASNVTNLVFFASNGPIEFKPTISLPPRLPTDPPSTRATAPRDVVHAMMADKFLSWEIGGMRKQGKKKETMDPPPLIIRDASGAQLREVQRESGDRHWELMVELFGFGFWLNF
ncbi:hypothetical protein HDU96_010493 [Phlyctochytrium bullatum]|nr:hypothetical protein HDU96_010493 [Phlyctochytrium bullatum]